MSGFAVAAVLAGCSTGSSGPQPTTGSLPPELTPRAIPTTTTTVVGTPTDSSTPGTASLLPKHLNGQLGLSHATDISSSQPDDKTTQGISVSNAVPKIGIAVAVVDCFRGSVTLHFGSEPTRHARCTGHLQVLGRTAAHGRSVLAAAEVSQPQGQPWALGLYVQRKA